MAVVVPDSSQVFVALTSRRGSYDVVCLSVDDLAQRLDNLPSHSHPDTVENSFRNVGRTSRENGNCNDDAEC